MRTYRIQFMICSSVLTPFAADTMFGALCWTYRHLYGEAQLVQFLQESDTTPLLVISDGFPPGHLPLPKLGPLSGSGVRLDKLKRFSARQWIGADQLKGLCDAPLSAERLFETLKDDEQERQPYQEQVIYRSSINRLTGAVTEGRLFPSIERFYTEGSAVEFYLKIGQSPLIDETILAQLLRALSLSGYGRKKSTGHGQLQWDGEFHPPHLPEVAAPNAFMSLSTFVPKRNDPRRGNYTPMTKYGRLAEEFAFRPTSGTTHVTKPFKKPIVMLKAGSLFFLNGEPLREYYGRLVANVHEHQGIRQHGFAYPLGLSVDDTEE